MIKNEKTIILMMVIVFLMVFTISVIFGVIFENMVIASAPIVLFWLFVMHHTFSKMNEF